MKASSLRRWGIQRGTSFLPPGRYRRSHHDPAVTMQSYEDGLEECELRRGDGIWTDWLLRNTATQATD